ncbi:head decoration protein [Desulfovibrio sp. ZJ200]|uniref:head decoration protein n=1 Tax=Desulfovibrio sp. ZJ200 TaxID=2709792 RepID=UPI0013EC7A40|nr:head decoration protein [Desulfovibrio sp. ZJ200]
MHHIESYQRPAFLKDHPPILVRMILASTGSEEVYLAGTVLGRDAEGKLAPWTASSAGVEGILVEDVTVPASGGATADVYVHASVVAQELIFADGVSAADEQTALAALRAKGIFA